MIHIYTDGGASGNPGPGGYGIVMLYKQHRKEMSEGYRLTTNNRMELLSVIVALESIKKVNAEVVLHSDSKYVIDSINLNWLDNWQKIGFKNKANVDLWKRFLKIRNKHHVKYVWVKGHAANVENNRCDELAVAAYKTKVLLVDEGYEASKGELL
ncbi:MAG: ribonuclease HI [Sphingobacteriaceae bacterium]|nr:ribonuclease HI [Sphingobacteriaceae bacterium]